jgi:hypothetical protein
MVLKVKISPKVEAEGGESAQDDENQAITTAISP